MRQHGGSVGDIEFVRCMTKGNMLIQLTLPRSITAYVEDSEDTVGTPGETEYRQHFELDFWGDKGRAWWIQNRDWGCQNYSMAEPFLEKTGRFDNDVPGQREFTRAMARRFSNDGDGRPVPFNTLPKLYPDE